MENRNTIDIREQGNGGREVFDIVRRRWVALTPEEWVRQNHIRHLHHDLGYPLELIQVEGAITLNGMTRRCDIVVYDGEVKPLIIVECKRETVALTQKVLDQASRYNMVLGVPYLCIINGPQQICCKVDFEKRCLVGIEELPFFGGEDPLKGQKRKKIYKKS